jgi:hypothetical protein
MACGTHSRTDTGSGFTCFITLSPIPITIHDCNIPPMCHRPIALNIEHTVTSHVFKFRASSLKGTWLDTEWRNSFLVPWVAKIRPLPSSCPSVRNTAAPTKMIFVKFDIGSFYEKLSRNKKFCSNRIKYCEIYIKTYYVKLYCQEKYEMVCRSTTLEIETILNFPQQQLTVLHCWQQRLC